MLPGRNVPPSGTASRDGALDAALDREQATAIIVRDITHVVRTTVERYFTEGLEKAVTTV